VNDVVILALIGVGSPILLSLLNGWQQSRAKQAEVEVRREEKAQEYARLDEVAAKAEAAVNKAAFKAAEVAQKAEEAATLLQDQQASVAGKAAEAAVLLLESNKDVAKTAKITNGKLDVIHQLVNSNMTAAMQSEMGALKAQLVLMHEVVDLKRAAGAAPSADALAAIEATKKKIQELQITLTDREGQAKVVADKEENARVAGTPIERGADS
jgi:hypothetical protein